MNSTWTLWRNDLRWAGPLALLGLLGHLTAWGAGGVAMLWIYPSGDWSLMNVAYYAAATSVLGLIAATVDEVTGTREYLFHRPQSHARIFWTRHSLMLGIVAAWAVSTPSLHLAGAHLFSLDAALIDDARWWLRICEGVPGLFFYALSVFCVSVTRTLWRGALLTVVAGLVFLGVVTASIVINVVGTAGIAALVGCVVLTPPLLVGALRSQRQGRDHDRPWDLRRLRLAGPLLILVVGITSAGATTLVHGFGSLMLTALYPHVALQDGKYILRRWSGDDRRYYRIDAEHRWAEPVSDSETSVPGVAVPSWARLGTDFISPKTFPGGGAWFRGQRFFYSYGSPRRSLFFGSDGYLHVYQLASRNGDGAERSSVSRVGKGQTQAPFSPDTIMLTKYYDRTSLLHDPADGGLWIRSLLGDEPAFVRADLPGGDKYLRVEITETPPIRDLLSLKAPAPPPLVIVGARGRYVPAEGGWRALPASAGLSILPKPTLEVRQHRAGRFDLTLRDGGGQPSFQHSFRPYTLAERSAELLVEGPTLLRPFPLVVASLWSSPARAYRPGGWLLLDPAVAIGTRGTLLGNGLLTVLLAGLMYARLRRLGVDAGRRRFWTVAVLLAGFPGYLCARFVETARAWQAATDQRTEGRASLPVRALLVTD